MHLHLVNFEVVGRYAIKFDTKSQNRFCSATGAVDGVCLEKKDTIQHGNVTGGFGFKARFPPSPATPFNPNVPVIVGAAYTGEQGQHKDSITALPGQVTVIRAKFDLLGKFVWHCHLLSHEDHEMMRVFEVV